MFCKCHQLVSMHTFLWSFFTSVYHVFSGLFCGSCRCPEAQHSCAQETPLRDNKPGLDLKQHWVGGARRRLPMQRMWSLFHLSLSCFLQSFCGSCLCLEAQHSCAQATPLRDKTTGLDVKTHWVEGARGRLPMQRMWSLFHLS